MTEDFFPKEVLSLGNLALRPLVALLALALLPPQAFGGSWHCMKNGIEFAKKITGKSEGCAVPEQVEVDDIQLPSGAKVKGVIVTATRVFADHRNSNYEAHCKGLKDSIPKLARSWIIKNCANADRKKSDEQVAQAANFEDKAPCHESRFFDEAPPTLEKRFSQVVTCKQMKRTPG